MLIITTLEGVYKSFSKHRIITIFQPHRFSRLTKLFTEFSRSFQRSDQTLIVPVYAAGESGGNYKPSKDLVNEIKNAKVHIAKVKKISKDKFLLNKVKDLEYEIKKKEMK